MFKLYPKISIITPSFNQGQYLEKTIQSVLNQNYPNLEYFIIDGKSNDNTMEILNRYRTKLIIISEKDQGQVDAINKGLRLATGEIVAFLNSDDMYEKNALYNIASTYMQHPDKNWFIGKCRIIDQTDSICFKFITYFKNLWLKRYSYQTLLILNYINQPAVFWKLDLIKKIGLFNESFHYGFDYEYWLRLGKSNKPLIINQNLSLFRIHSLSKGSTSYLKQFEEDYHIAKKFTHNKILTFFHFLSYIAIITIYRFIK